MQKRTVLLAVLTCSLLSLNGCATGGGLAGNGKPVDKTETLKATCEGLSKIDVAFQAFTKAEPGIVPDNVVASENAIVSAFFSRTNDGTLTPIGVCSPPYATDVDTALNNLISATIGVSTLLAHWKH